MRGRHALPELHHKAQPVTEFPRVDAAVVHAVQLGFVPRLVRLSRRRMTLAVLLIERDRARRPDLVILCEQLVD